MTLPVLIGVGLAGGLGAIARFLIGAAVTAQASRTHHRFPYGTLAVNLSGAFALGIVVGAALHGRAYTIVAVGFLGAYTTFSTWMADSRRLTDEGEWRLGAINLALSSALGLLAVWLGRTIAG